MAFDKHVNFGYTTVATAPVTPLTGTSLTVALSTGRIFPVPPFNITVWPSSVLSLSAVSEICRVTAVSGDVFTITRAQENSIAQPIAVSYQVIAGITSKTLTDVENAIPATTDALPQGSTNLYFTEQAGRNSLSGGSVEFSTFAIGAVSGATSIDFTKGQYQTVSLSGNSTFNTTNRLTGRSTTLKISNVTNSSFNLAFNQNWSWLTINYSTSTTILSTLFAMLTLTPLGPNESDVIAVLAYQG